MNSAAGKILAGLAALALAFAGGWYTAGRFQLAGEAKDAKAQVVAVVEQSNEVRQQERTAQKEVNNEDKLLQERLAVAGRERDDAVERLRRYKSAQLANVPSAAGGAGQCDGPPVARLRVEDGEAALRIAGEADVVAEQLRAAQAILAGLTHDDDSGGSGK
ncbi:hypothetical protein [Cupriavidus basilensis]|uniref:hypothetical protein n=1 Tax=Cupriavidus basilensis TaxID=68895 RepID=UPI0020A6D0B3|nr:hypothetical protein [Cupriavidus basilensis]MCP3023248.1 hypothetical protein [Cupriavidus basilensis]